MLIDQVNLNHIRVFECVCRNRSMTLAAQELHLTQSGVSQHIKSLEGILGVELFDRIQQKLVPTATATALYERCRLGLKEIEQGIWALKGNDAQLSGSVSFGLPTEFGNNVVLPLITNLCHKYPLIKFKIRFGFASAMNEALLRGELDFAFVDEYGMDRRVKSDRVYDEVLELCATDEFLKEKGAPKNIKRYFESLDYVEYQEEEPILRMWFAHHLGTKHIDLKVRATVMDTQAVARLILAGAGAGILPSHLVQKLHKEGKKLYRFKGCGRPLKNIISVAYLAERSQSPAARVTLDALREGMLP